MVNNTPVLIAKPVVHFDEYAGLWIWSCAVDGKLVVMRSKARLEPRADAMLCAMLFPSLAAKRKIVCDAPVDAQLMENLSKAARVAKTWWGYDGPLPHASNQMSRRPGNGRGLFFSSGVDSFYTLQRFQGQLSHIINVHGYDVAVTDVVGYEAMRSGMQAVADDLGIGLISVECNLRSHPLFDSLHWRETHIAALSAVAHALGGMVSRVHAAGSDVAPPWGQHPDLDPLWSSSGLQIINDERDIRKFDKVRAIAHWPPAQKNLRVCWKSASHGKNCGSCEKCVRTQAALNAVGALEAFNVFPAGDLRSRIRALRFLKPPVLPQWTRIRDNTQEPEIIAALGRLLWRSRLSIPLRLLMRRTGLTKIRFLQRLAGRGLFRLGSE